MTGLAQSGHSSFEDARSEDARGEFWSARELQGPLGYDQWRRFEDSIERAMAAATNSGMDPADHFAGTDKMVEIGSRAVRLVVDYRLTRYGAYLVAMNGDPRKPEIAAAQTYFAVRTREAETAPVRRELTRLELIEIARDAEVGRLAAEARVAELAPAAAVGLALVSAGGDYSLREAAQLLSRDHGIETGRGRLIAELQQIRWLDRSKQPYQRQIDAGRLAVRTSTYDHPGLGRRVGSRQVRVTPKGLAWLHEHWPRAASGDVAVTP